MIKEFGEYMIIKDKVEVITEKYEIGALYEEEE